MTAAAQLEAVARHLDHPHRIAVLLAEQRHGAPIDGVPIRHKPLRHLFVRPNLLVHQPLDFLQLTVAQRPAVREVEAQPVRRHQRAGLRDVLTQHGAQRCV